jgi:hypothetical protein
VTDKVPIKRTATETEAGMSIVLIILIGGAVLSMGVKVHRMRGGGSFFWWNDKRKDGPNA